jgi:hypothetical protein
MDLAKQPAMTTRNVGMRTFTTKPGAAAIAVLAATLLLQGCGGSDPTGGGGDPAVPVDAWTLTGTVAFPANEAATQLKLVATTSSIVYGSAAFVSAPVALTLSGSPPTADFSLSIDMTGKTGSVELMVFQDLNDDGGHAVAEPSRSMDPVLGSDVWCDADSCHNVAYFAHLNAGTSGYSSTDGSWEIVTSGWYVDQGCGSHACAQLIVGPLTGARVGYNEYAPGPIATP